eukprot:m.293421 g.293421  ORF g.293421 m.293421 type:complete len:511 (-) comp20018_c0_seq1:49-1581(-)
MKGSTATMSPVVLSTQQLAAMKIRASEKGVRDLVGDDLATVSESREARKKALHMKSLAETKEWNGTIVGERQRRLAAKAERKAQQEQAARELDLEEERYQAAKRKEQLDRAKLLLIQEKDGIKSFRSAQLLTEVIRERDNQGNSKEARDKFYETQDMQYLQKQLEENEKAVRAEVEKQERMRLAEMDTAKTQLEQAAAIRQSKRRERQAELIEQKAMLEDSSAYLESESKKVIQQRKHNREFLTGMDAAKREAEAIRAKEAELEQLEQLRDAQYLEAKEAMMKERQERILQTRKKKAEDRQQLADSLFVQIESNEAEENDRIRRYQEQLEQQQDAREAAKAKERQQGHKATIEHMHKTIKETQEQRKKRLEDERAEREQIIADSQAYFAKKTQIKQEVRQENKKLLGDWESQMEERRRMQEATKQDAVAYRSEQQAAIDADQRELEAYMAATEDFMRQRGCTNTVPMQKVAQSLKPFQPKPAPHLPSQSVRRKGNPYPGNTKKRLGFNWE